MTVWENGSAKDGKTSTSNFISGMYGAVPPLQDMFNMAGMDLPEYVKGKDQQKPTDAIEDAEEVKEDEE